MKAAARLVEKPEPSGLGRVLDLPLARIRAFAGQPRKHFDRAALADLQASIAAVGQQVPVTVRPVLDGKGHDFELVDGERRFRVHQELKRDTIRAWVRDDLAAGGGDQFLASVVSNFARAGHTLFEVAEAIAVLEQHPAVRALPTRGEQHAHLGALFGRSAFWVQQHAALLKLTPAVRAALKGEAAPPLTLSALVMMAQLPAARQDAILATITNRRLKAAGAIALIRKARLATQEPGQGRPMFDQPAREWARLMGGAGAIADRADVLLETPAKALRAALAARSRDDRAALVKALGAAAENLTEFAQAVRNTVREIDRGGA